MKNTSTIVVALAALALGSAVYQGLERSGNMNSQSPELVAKFSQWSLEHKRLYSTPSELSARIETFKQNLDKIEAIN